MLLTSELCASVSFLMVLPITMHAFQLTLGLLLCRDVWTIPLIWLAKLVPSSTYVILTWARKKPRARRAFAETLNFSDRANCRMTASNCWTFSGSAGASLLSKNALNSLVACDERTYTCKLLSFTLSKTSLKVPCTKLDEVFASQGWANK